MDGRRNVGFVEGRLVISLEYRVSGWKVSKIKKLLSYTYPVYVIGKENSESFFFRSPLMRKRRQIFATCTERWLGYELAEDDQSLDLLGRQI
jgi:hypothetical protein